MRQCWLVCGFNLCSLFSHVCNCGSASFLTHHLHRLLLAPFISYSCVVYARFLFNWWDHLDNLDAVKDLVNIHRIKKAVVSSNSLPGPSEIDVEVYKASN